MFFTSGAECPGALELYNAQGRLVHRESFPCRKGENERYFDGRSADGTRLAAGAYFLRLQVGSVTLGPRKLVLLGTGRAAR